MELSQPDNIKASVRFLTSNNPYEQEYGLKVLINFTSKSTPDNRVQIVVFRVITIDTFASLLCSTSEVLQMLTAWLLFHLTIADVNAATVMDSGLMQYVVPLLESDTDDVTEKALLLTTNLSLSASHSHLLTGYGVVEVLTGLLNHSSPLISATAAQPLRNLLHKDSCSEFNENQRLFCHSGGVKVVKEIYSSFPPPGEELLQGLGSVLHVLSIHNDIIRRIIAAAGLLTPLVSIMTSATTSQYNQELILKILTNLSLTPETEPAFITARALRPLVDMLYLPDASFTTKHLTVTILANLSCNEQIREMLRYSGLTANLVELIANTTSTDLLEPAVIVVTNLAIDEFIRMELWEAGAQAVMTHLITLTKIPGPIREATRVALKNLSLPISEQVQALIEQTMTDDDDTVEADDILADQTPIIPLPGNQPSPNMGAGMFLHPNQNYPNAPVSPKANRNSGERKSEKLAFSNSPNINGAHRNTIERGSPLMKPAASPNNRDSSKHVTPPPPTSRMNLDASPGHTTPPPPSPHYTTSPPPPLSRRPSANAMLSQQRNSMAPQRTPSLDNSPKTSPQITPTTPSLPPPSVTLTAPNSNLIPSPSITPTPTPNLTPTPTPNPTTTQPAPPSTTTTANSNSATATPPRPKNEHAKLQRAMATTTLRRPVLTVETGANNETPGADQSPRPQLNVAAPTSPSDTGRARSLTKQTNIRRNHIAKEIFDTEQNYMRSLSVCIRMYLNPLLVGNPELAPVPPEFVRDIFVNIQRIFKLTCEFLKKFKTSIARAAVPSPPNSPQPTSNKPHGGANGTIIPMSNLGDVSFGELFLWLFNETKIIPEYIEYINGFDTARLLIESECAKNSKFKDYLEKARVTPECKGLTIQALLIMPVQRIPRHILLLTDLIKHTPPEHHDYAVLTKAVERTKEVADVINAAKGRAESNTKMTLLQSSLLGCPDGFILNSAGRLLVKDGSMMMSEDKKKGGSKYSYLYLFTDVLLFTRQQKTKYHFIRTLPLVELKVVDIPPNETGQHAFLLLWSTEGGEKEFTLASSKLEEKEFWLNGMKDAITSQKKSRHDRISRNMSNGPLPTSHPLYKKAAEANAN